MKKKTKQNSSARHVTFIGRHRAKAEIGVHAEMGLWSRPGERD